MLPEDPVVVALVDPVFCNVVDQIVLPEASQKRGDDIAS
jgi:hypothetical protein